MYINAITRWGGGSFVIHHKHYESQAIGLQITAFYVSEPLKISKTDNSMKPSSVSSTDSLGNRHPSGVDVLSTPASSSNSGRLDDGSSSSSGSNNLRTEPQSPLLSSPLVFHNSNFSPGSAAAVTPMEVLGSQVHGGSYLVPTMFQPLVPFIQQPAAMAMPNPLMSQWVAATMSANQVRYKCNSMLGSLN